MDGLKFFQHKVIFCSFISKVIHISYGEEGTHMRITHQFDF